MKYQTGTHATWLNNKVVVEDTGFGQLFVVHSYDGFKYSKLTMVDALNKYEQLCGEVLNMDRIAARGAK